MNNAAWYEDIVSRLNTNITIPYIFSKDVGQNNVTGLPHKILYQGETFHVKPNTVHRFGSFVNPCKIVEVSTPELDDVVRLADDYNR